MTKSKVYFDIAFEEAKASADRGEVPVGAVLVAEDGSVLSRAGNRMRELCDPTAHAEVLAIREGCSLRGSDRLPGIDLYVTLEPCTLCAAAISFARLRRVYFAAYDIKGGGVSNGVCFFHQESCHHVPEVYGGFNETRARDLLKSFFSELRR